jgi:2-dehydro-3-deoxyphosphogluconate aldolase/(4S)-4-hydroxy-2-oxoglutarate aldolase
MVSTEELDAAIRRERLVAILRGRNRAATVETARTLIDAGITIVEVSLSGVDALAALREICAHAEGALVGAGTVVEREDADAAVAAGARFIVTPGNGPGAERSAEVGVPCLIGALTPTEIAAAARTAVAVKLFPAAPAGLDYFRAVREPFPDVPLIPVGGVDARLAEAYLAAGAVAVGVGGPLVGDAASRGGDLAALARRATEFREVARG